MSPIPLSLEQVAFMEGVEAAQQEKAREVPVEFQERSEW